MVEVVPKDYTEISNNRLVKWLNNEDNRDY